MTSIKEETGATQGAAVGERPKATQKASGAKRARHAAPAKRKAMKKGHLRQESAQGREKCQFRPRRQQGYQNPGLAEAVWRRDR